MENKKITISENELIELCKKFHNGGVQMGSLVGRDIIYRSKPEFDKFRLNPLIEENISKLFK